MNSIVLQTSKSTVRSIRSAPAIQLISRRGVTTQQLDATKGDRERVVILGSGWSGFVLSRELDKKKFQAVVVSPRSYFVFTPLLASAAVGTLEARTTLESVRRHGKGVEFFQGWADDVNFNEKTLSIEETTRRRDTLTSNTSDISVQVSLEVGRGPAEKGQIFSLKYDKLVVAVGCYSQTFNTPGVREHAFFLKDVGDSIRIRRRILECFETASCPTTSEELRNQLLNFAIVGGGPTGIEFAAELYDLCREDLRRLYPALIPHIKITIYDVAPKILPMFDKNLAQYALNRFKRDGISIKTEHHIEELRPGLPGSKDLSLDGGCFTLKTRQDGEFGVGMCVWSTGLMMNPFIKKALDDVRTFPKSSVALSTKSSDPPESQKWSLKRHPRTGGLMVDDKLRVKLIPRNEATDGDNGSVATMKDVFAIGDVSVLETGQLPATAQVANQQGKWLGKRLNKGDLETQAFTFKSLGVMTYIGNWKAIMQSGSGGEIKGWTAWVIWRGAYLSQTISIRNKLLIPMYWAINSVFGRDISRF